VAAGIRRRIFFLGAIFLLPRPEEKITLVFVAMEIMKTFLIRSHAGLIVSLALFGGTSNTRAADLVLQKVPQLSVEQAPADPKNLARHHLGARVDAVTTSTEVKADVSALLSSDPTTTCSLAQGRTTVVLAFSKIENIGGIALTNNGAKGSIAVATSSAKLPANSPQWHDALKKELSADGLEAKIGPGEAKYVRLTFDLTQGGQIGGFGVYEDDSFSLAQVSASGGTESSADDSAIEQQDGSSYDGKTTIDGKTMIDTKDMPGVGAGPPGEGPPPSLPHPPPFTFVPVIVPRSL